MYSIYLPRELQLLQNLLDYVIESNSRNKGQLGDKLQDIRLLQGVPFISTSLR